MELEIEIDKFLYEELVNGYGVREADGLVWAFHNKFGDQIDASLLNKAIDKKYVRVMSKSRGAVICIDETHAEFMRRD